MKIVIFGSGFMGHHFLNHLKAKHDVVLSDMRIEGVESLRAYLADQKPDAVINAAGKTGRPNVDWCEDNKGETLFSNVTAPLILAKVCEEMDIHMTHIGSGCVYEGGPESVYTEEDAPNFDGSFYSRTKEWLETMLSEFPVLQLRLRMPLDGEPGPRNFITKITKYEKVISIPNSISVVPDFLEAAETLIEKGETGVFNMTNPGFITHAEILDMYKEIVDQDFEYSVMSLNELEKITKARRSNCVLSADKMLAAGAKMRPVHEAVRDMLENYAKNMV